MSSVAQLQQPALSTPADTEPDLTTRLLTVASEVELRIQELEHERRRLTHVLEQGRARDRVMQYWLKQIRRAHRRWSHAMTARTIRQACAALIPAVGEVRHVRQAGVPIATTAVCASTSER